MRSIEERKNKAISWERRDKEGVNANTSPILAFALICYI